jgi:hypothetical protein
LCPSRLRARLAVPALAWLVLSGCATHPPPLPAALPAQLPGAWLGPLASAPGPGPFRSELRIRISTRNRPQATLNGTLRAILPDTLEIGAQFGPFKPIFALHADADSCELLLHGEARYWIVAREHPDWELMTPAAWAQALEWALCPADLLRRLEPDGPGRMGEDGLWEISGPVRGTPFRVEARVDPRRRSVRGLRVSQSGVLRLEARLGAERRVGEAWIPTELTLRSPKENLVLETELLGPKGSPRSGLRIGPVVRPTGWQAVEGAAILPVPGTP